MNYDPQIRLSDAIRAAGSQAKLAAGVGINRANVSIWKRQGLEFLPPLYGYRFERVFGQQVSESVS